MDQAMSDRNTERDDDELTLTCRSCGHAWPARLGIWGTKRPGWITALEAQSCGQCGAAYRVSSWGKM